MIEMKKILIVWIIMLFSFGLVLLNSQQTTEVDSIFQDLKLEVVSPPDGATIDTTTPTLKVKFNRDFKSREYVFFYAFVLYQESPRKLVFSSKSQNPSVKVGNGFLEGGKTYIWIAGAYAYSVKNQKQVKDSSGKDLVIKSKVAKFTIKGSQSNSGGEVVPFQKKGNTLVVAVEFEDKKHSGDWIKTAKEKMDAIKNYYQTISYGSRDVEEINYDIFPEKILIKGNMADYGADKKNKDDLWMTDAGNTDKPWGGRYKMLEAVVTELLVKYKVPLQEYHHLIYFSPGDGGAKNGSDQFWPASNGTPPSSIYYDAKKRKIFNYQSGVVQGIDVPTGVLAHEFGHQYGLPDLYPYSYIPKRDLDFAALMAGGGWEFVCMTMVSRIKDYHKKRLKSNWCKGKYEIVKLKKAGEEKKYTLWARDSRGDKLTVFVKLPKKKGYYMVSVFDRKGVDKKIYSYIKKQYLSKETGTSLNKSPSKENSILDKIVSLIKKGNNKSAKNLLEKVSSNYYKTKAGVLIAYVDSMDVDKIREAYLEPKSYYSFYGGKFFLDGGYVEKYGVKIMVDKIYEKNERYVADIKIKRTE